MIQINPDELDIQLKKKLMFCYILCGEDFFLINQSKNTIISKLQASYTCNCFKYILNTNTNWDSIFNKFQSLYLFGTHNIFLINVLEQDIRNCKLDKNFLILTRLLNDKNILILSIDRLTKYIKNSYWFKNIINILILVNCNTPDYTQLPYWISMKAKKLSLLLDASSYELLCYCYEGNLLELNQTLEHLSIIYNKSIINLSKIQKVINDLSRFNPSHWIHAILSGEYNRAKHILNQLKLTDIEITFLLRKLQREILLLIHIKLNIIQTPINTLLDNYKIWKKYYRILLNKASKRLHLNQLQNIIFIMTKLEITLKTDMKYHVWDDLMLITLIFCNNNFKL